MLTYRDELNKQICGTFEACGLLGKTEGKKFMATSGADLIEKLERFLSLSWEQRRDMGLAGRTKVEREFDRKIVVEKYLKELP